MKRKYIFIILLFLVMLLSSCDKKNSTTKDETSTITTTTVTTVVTTDGTTSTTTKEETPTSKETTIITTTTSEVTETIVTVVSDDPTTIVTTTEPVTTVTTTVTTTTTKQNGSKPADTGSIYLDDYYKNFDFSTLYSGNQESIIYAVKNYMKSTASYKGFGYQWLRSKYVYLDAVDLNDMGDIVAFYTRKHIDGTWDQGKTWNREHVFARSLGGFDKDDPAGYDMYNVRPTITEVNSARGNKVFGTVAHTSKNEVKYNGEVVAWTTSNVFEPCDDVKGDVARICFYMAVMYYKEYTKKVELKLVVEDKTFQTLLEWNEMDPVSEEEIRRCDLISNYLDVNVTFQGNRNIFVDYPEIASIIWG